MDGKQEFVEMMNDWGYSVNARIKFNDFINAVETKEGLIVAVQKIYQVIDDIVLKKEVSQFRTSLQPGTKYYRARIIDPTDDNNLEKGIGKTVDGKFLGYNEINSREPVLGISGEGRNNITGASYLYIASNSETACMEIKSQFGDLISLAVFELTKPLSIIGFASEKTFQRKDTELYGMSLGVFFSQLHNLHPCRVGRCGWIHGAVCEILWRDQWNHRSEKGAGGQSRTTGEKEIALL